MISKTELRKELLKKRNTLTKEECRKYSTLIENQLLTLDAYKKADIILIYASYQKEVFTYGIINQALSMGKRVFCPKVLSPGIMEFYEIYSLNDISPGYKDIPEPNTGHSMFKNVTANTLMLMPLVGFDDYKNRLGYGGGFYDRYLQRFPRLRQIGLAFECQRLEHGIPTEETDIKPDYILTEQGIF